METLDESLENWHRREHAVWFYDRRKSFTTTH